MRRRGHGLVTLRRWAVSCGFALVIAMSFVSRHEAAPLDSSTAGQGGPSAEFKESAAPATASARATAREPGSVLLLGLGLALAANRIRKTKQ